MSSHVKLEEESSGPVSASVFFMKCEDTLSENVWGDVNYAASFHESLESNEIKIEEFCFADPLLKQEQTLSPEANERMEQRIFDAELIIASQKIDINSSSTSKKKGSSQLGEKPFACDLCSYTCCRKCDLMKHNLTHTGKESKKSWVRKAHRRSAKRSKEILSGQARETIRMHPNEVPFHLTHKKNRSKVTKDIAVGENKLVQCPPSTLLLRGCNKRSPQAARDTPSALLMKYLLENNKKSDHIDQFFASIATTVKSFPIKDRAIAKARVFEMVSEMELEILNRSNLTPSCDAVLMKLKM